MACGSSGVVGKDLEEASAQDGLSIRQRRLEVAVADGDNLEVRRRDEVQLRSGLEERPEVEWGHSQGAELSVRRLLAHGCSVPP